MRTFDGLTRLPDDQLTRRGFLALLAGVPAGVASRAWGALDPPATDVHRQLLELASRQQQQRRARFAAVRDQAGLTALRGELRVALLEALGGLPRGEGPPPAHSVGQLDGDGYRVEKLVFESLPGLHVPALLYRPLDASRPAPGILSPCGHSDVGKAAGPYQILHANLARRGFWVLTYDPVGQGERSQFWDARRGRSRFNLTCGEHAVLGTPLYLLGMNLARYRVHDGRRALDYLASLPGVDPVRLGCVGNSGGGTLTAYITALDERVKAAVIGCYVTALPRRMANRVPADPDADPEQDLFGFVSRGIDHAGLLALCAPRPTLLCTARQDFFPIEGARETFEEARRLYAAAGAGDRVARVEADQKHGLTPPLREAAYGWFERWLLGRPSADRREEITAAPRSEKDLAVCPDGQVSVSFRSRHLLPLALEEFKARGGRVRRSPLTALLAADGDEPAFVLENLTEVTERGRSVVVLVNGNEAPDWRRERALRDALTAGGHAVAVVDTRGMGRLRPALSVPGHSYDDPLCGVEENLAYNAFLVGRSLLSMRVADVRAAVARVRSERQPARVVLCGRRDAALVCALAAAVDPTIGGLAVEEMPLSLLPWFGVEGHPVNAASILPGLLRDFGDIPDVLAEVVPRPVLAAAPRFTTVRPLPGIRVDTRRFTVEPAQLLDWLRS